MQAAGQNRKDTLNASVHTNSKDSIERLTQKSRDEDEYRQGFGGKRQKSLQQSFKAISKEEYFNSRLKSKTIVPPIGNYNTKFDSVER